MAIPTLTVLKFQSGINGRHVNELWTSLDYLTEGHNVLVVRLADNGSELENRSTKLHFIIIIFS